MKPMQQGMQNEFIVFYYIIYKDHVIMKTEPSYTFFNTPS